MQDAKIFQGVISPKWAKNPINGAQDTDVSDGTIVVSQVSFDLGSTLKGTPIRKSSASDTG